MMLRLANPRFGDEATAAIGRVLATGQLTQGPVVAQFEAAIADLCGVPHGVATTSATTAIELALAAHDIGPGDEVLVPDFTYPATGNAVLQRRAHLRLVDVDPETWCVDVDQLEAAIGPRTRAVITVDIFGLPADYERIEPLLVERGVALICDAACSLGGAVQGRRVGGFGAASCLSFHPRKSLTTGEGGMALSADSGLVERMRRLRNHGAERRGGWRSTFTEPGFNYRLSDVSAALGLVQAPHHPAVVERRRELAALLTEKLPHGATPQLVPTSHRHPYQSYVVVLEPAIDRDAVILSLRDAGIESTLGTYALHAEPAFAGIALGGGLPVSRYLAEHSLALPLHEHLSSSDIDTIADALTSAIAQR